MRTQQEILNRVKECESRDVLGFELNEYLRALHRVSLESLRGTIIKDDADLSDYSPDLNSDKEIRDQCVKYMDFAWEKANNCRGISSGRSMRHYKAWLWLLGENEFEDIDDYEYYGKPQLVRICNYLGLNSSRWDDGIRTNTDD